MNPIKEIVITTALFLGPLFMTKAQEYNTTYEKKLAQEKYWESKEGFEFKAPKFPLSLLNKLNKKRASYEYSIHNGNEKLIIHEKDSAGKSEIKIIEKDHYGTVEQISLIKTASENPFLFTAEKINGKIKLCKFPKDEYSNPINLMNIYLDSDRKFWMFRNYYRIEQKVKNHNPKLKTTILNPQTTPHKKSTD